jgi:hypothetical protein
MTSAAIPRRTSTNADAAMNAAATTRPAETATLKPERSWVTRTPGVPIACNAKKPPVARNAMDKRNTRASPRRSAASPAAYESATTAVPIVRNTTKCSRWLSHAGSRCERRSNDTNPASGRTAAIVHANPIVNFDQCTVHLIERQTSTTCCQDDERSDPPC